MRTVPSFVRSGWIAVVLLAFAMGWYGTIDPATVPGADLHAYRPMAEAAPGFAETVPAPFVYRILPPWLAGNIRLVTGMSDTWAFTVVTMASLAAALTLLLRRLQRAGASTALAAVVAGLFVLNPYIVGATVYNPFQACDAVALLCILAALEALDDGRTFRLAVWLALGALTREPCLLVLLPVVVRTVRRGDRSAWLAFVGAATPAVALTVAVRLAITPVEPGPGFLTTVVDYLPKWVDPATWMRIVVTTFLPIGLLPWVHPRPSLAWLRANTDLALFSAAVLASSFLGGDVERLLAPAVVLAYPLAAITLSRLRPWGWVVMTGIALVGSLHYRYAVLSPFSREAYAAVALATAVAAAGATLVPRLMARNTPRP